MLDRARDVEAQIPSSSSPLLPVDDELAAHAASQRRDRRARWILGGGLIGVLALVAVASRDDRARESALGIGGAIGLVVGAREPPRATKLVPRALDGLNVTEKARARANAELYRFDGDASLDAVPYYDLTAYPSAALKRAIDSLRTSDEATYEAFGNVHEEYGRLVADRIGARKDVGASLSAVTAWVNAKRQGLGQLIVATPKGYVNSHAGPPTEFDSFVLSFMLRGPKRWDVVFLDRGERGVSEDNLKRPEALFTNKAWEQPYLLYNNTASIVGERLETNLYMVSKMFLDRLPSHMREMPMVNVDNWLNDLCAHGKLTCYSYTAKNWYDGLSSKHKANAVEPNTRAPIFDPNTARAFEEEERNETASAAISQERTDADEEDAAMDKTVNLPEVAADIVESVSWNEVAAKDEPDVKQPVEESSTDPTDIEVRAMLAREAPITSWMGARLGTRARPDVIAKSTRAYTGDEIDRFF